MFSKGVVIRGLFINALPLQVAGCNTCGSEALHLEPTSLARSTNVNSSGYSLSSSRYVSTLQPGLRANLILSLCTKLSRGVRLPHIGLYTTIIDPILVVRE